MGTFIRSGRAKVRRVSRRPSFRPWLEPLEDRTLLNAGALDPTFGNGGVVVDQSALLSPFNWNSVLAVQPDGRILEAISTPGCAFEIVRENTDGSLDGAFGTGGAIFVSLDQTGAISEGNGSGYLQDALTPPATPTAMTVQADGKILVAGNFVYGYTEIGPSPTYPGEIEPDIIALVPLTHAFLARFNSDGTLDTSFGAGGVVVSPFGSDNGLPQSSDAAYAMTVQADGKIIVAGSSSDEGLGQTGQTTLVRYNPDGSLDPTFGDDGTVVVADRGSFSSVALQADGKIVAVGTYDTPTGGTDVLAARFNSDGSLDATFGDGGLVETPVGNFGISYATDVAVQANGEVTATGFAHMRDSNYNDYEQDFLVRYTPDGQADSTFGDGGVVLVSGQPSDGIVDPQLALQADGKILLADTTSYNADPGSQVILRRFDGDGGLDPTFGDGGVAASTLGLEGVSTRGLALEPDGAIVVAGAAYDPAVASTPPYAPYVADPFLIVARFENDSTPLVIPVTPPVLTGPPASPGAPPASTPAPTAAPSDPAPSPAPDATAPTVPSVIVATTPTASVQALLLDGPSQPLPAPATPAVPASAVSVPPPASDPTAGSGPSNSDPFGIHIVGGSNPVVPDSTGDPNVLSSPSPTMPVDATTTDQAALTPAPQGTSFAVPTVVLDMVFQLVPLWTRAVPVAAPLPAAVAPLTSSPVPAAPAAPVVNDGHAAASQRWPALAVGAVLSLGLVAAEADRSRRRARRSNAAE